MWLLENDNGCVRNDKIVESFGFGGGHEDLV